MKYIQSKRYTSQLERIVHSSYAMQYLSQRFIKVGELKVHTNLLISDYLILTSTTSHVNMH